MLRLRRYDGSLPGGYPYVQPETGMKFSGNEAWRPQINIILRHRIGNNLPRATRNEVADDLEAFQCARLPNLCLNMNAKQSAVVASTPTRGATRVGCGHCGARRK